jgi:hypothetical protein
MGLGEEAFDIAGRWFLLSRDGMEWQNSAERQAELADYARRHGQDAANALDEVAADALAWERKDLAS